MNIIQDASGLVNRKTKTDFFCFPNTQCSQNSNCPVHCPLNKPRLLNIVIFFALMCPKRMYHNVVRSDSDREVETAAEPKMVLPYNTYKLPHFFPFITVSAPKATFITPPSKEHLHPLSSRVLTKIKFFLKSGTCRTSDKVLTTPSCM
ncbi:hypothetical protein Dimus_039063 [Dionaea muscipula]